MPLPPHSSHCERRRPCSQMPLPPHSLHSERCHPCLQMPLTPRKAFAACDCAVVLRGLSCMTSATGRKDDVVASVRLTADLFKPATNLVTSIGSARWVTMAVLLGVGIAVCGDVKATWGHVAGTLSESSWVQARAKAYVSSGKREWKGRGADELGCKRRPGFELRTSSMSHAPARH